MDFQISRASKREKRQIYSFFRYLNFTTCQNIRITLIYILLSIRTIRQIIIFFVTLEFPNMLKYKNKLDKYIHIHINFT